MAAYLSQCSSWGPILASPLHLELLASSFQHVDGQTLHAHPQGEVVVGVGEKHCQDDADGAEPELVNDDEAVYGSGAGDAGCYGQLCHHHYLSQSRAEELKKENTPSNTG